MPYTQEEWRGEKMWGNKTDFFYKLRQREVGREGAQPRDKCDGGKKTTALFTWSSLGMFNTHPRFATTLLRTLKRIPRTLHDRSSVLAALTISLAITITLHTLHKITHTLNGLPSVLVAYVIHLDLHNNHPDNDQNHPNIILPFLSQC